MNDPNKKAKPFLYDFQMEAVNKAFNGCVFNGDVGSGKSRTGLFYYFKEQGGWIDENGYVPMKNPKDLYIITTAMKRDKAEWNGELIPFEMYPKPELNRYNNKIVVDSWNNIKKYVGVYGAFFIFDEQRVVGRGSWVKAFLKITAKNRWILLSATPGDTWSDYIPVFVANGFYKNRSEFIREHIIYKPYLNYPDVDRYINTGRLIYLRNYILIPMKYDRQTIPHHITTIVNYNKTLYKRVWLDRWDVYNDEPLRETGKLFYTMRQVVNSDPDRIDAVSGIIDKHDRIIIFYNFDYELEILRNLSEAKGIVFAEWNGKKHEPVPEGERWLYLVQYMAGAEGWNCITTDTVIFYSQNYSYRLLTQAEGRIDRLNTAYKDLYYYHVRSNAPIDIGILRALRDKKNFNEKAFMTAKTFSQ